MKQKSYSRPYFKVWEMTATQVVCASDPSLVSSPGIKEYESEEW